MVRLSVALVVLGLLPGPAAAQPPARRLVIAATGDLLLHGSVVDGARARPDGFRRMLAGLAETMEPDALGIVNIETPLTEDVVRPRVGDHPVLGAPGVVADVLRAAGVDVAQVANNHAYDQGPEGLSRTVRELERAGMVAVGAGPDHASAHAPRLVEHAGLRIAFVSGTGPLNRHVRRAERTFHVARLEDEADVLSAVRDARRQADVVVALVHWMYDFRKRPNRTALRLARRLVEAGADVIVGTGPHVLQRVDRLPSPRGEAVVCWSLGNLISGMGREYDPERAPPPGLHPVQTIAETRDGAVVHLDLEARPGGGLRLVSARARALWTANDWNERGADGPADVRVIRLSEAPAAVRAARLPLIRAALGPLVTLTE